MCGGVSIAVTSTGKQIRVKIAGVSNRLLHKFSSELHLRYDGAVVEIMFEDAHIKDKST
jgi:hypothetical protein